MRVLVLLTLSTALVLGCSEEEEAVSTSPDEEPNLRCVRVHWTDDGYIPLWDRKQGPDAMYTLCVGDTIDSLYVIVLQNWWFGCTFPLSQPFTFSSLLLEDEERVALQSDTYRGLYVPDDTWLYGGQLPFCLSAISTPNNGIIEAAAQGDTVVATFFPLAVFPFPTKFGIGVSDTMRVLP